MQYGAMDMRADSCHLLSTTTNAERLLQAICELSDGKGIERELIEPDDQVSDA